MIDVFVKGIWIVWLFNLFLSLGKICVIVVVEFVVVGIKFMLYVWVWCKFLCGVFKIVCVLVILWMVVIDLCLILIFFCRILIIGVK